MKSELVGFFAGVLIVFQLLPASLGQNDDNWPSLSYLRSDYRHVSVVARVQVRKAEIVNRIGGYEDWHLTGDVIESFKGRFRKGSPIDFYHGAEKGFRQEVFLGDKIVFLFRNFVEKENRWVLAVLENSTLSYTPDRAQKLRVIQRAARRKTKPRTGRAG